MNQFNLINNYHYDLLSSSKKLGYPIQQYRHDKFGLEVIFIDCQGPSTLATIVVPTFCDNNKGIPHTLEHLIFCGSKNYPLRGYLEALACQSLSTGTNAWTAPDHTAYTFSTLGYEGLIQTLPVYLDHIINPSLLDRDFYTEVFHMDGDGEYQGVVYNEMKARQHTEADVLDLTLRQMVYPKDGTYYHECGGLTQEIEKLTNSEVRDYHSKYYSLDKVTILIAGQNLPKESILDGLINGNTLKKGKEIIIRDTINKDSNLNELECEEVKSKIVTFPSEEMNCGSIGFVWKGPKLSDFQSRMGIDLLLYHLTDSPASFLQQNLIGISLPYCSNIDYELRTTLPFSSIWLTFSGVPNQLNYSGLSLNLNERYGLLSEGGLFQTKLLKLVRDGIDQLNLNELRNSINRFKLDLLERLEDDGLELIIEELIPIIIHSNDQINSDIKRFCNQINLLNELINQPLDYWKGLAEEWILDIPFECIAKPDQELGQLIEFNKNNLLKLRKENLGEIGLINQKEWLNNILVDIKEHTVNEILLNKLTFQPNLELIPMLNNNVSNLNNVKDSNKLFDNILLIEMKTQFSQLSLNLNVSNLPENLKCYYVLFQALLFQLDLVLPDNNYLPYNEAVKKTSKLTINRHIGIGLGNQGVTLSWLPDLYQIEFKTLPNNLINGFDWLIQNLIYGEFSLDRILSISRNLLKELEEISRDGDFMLNCLTHQIINLTNLTFNQTQLSISLFKQEEFLSDLISSLNNDNQFLFHKDNLNQLRSHLIEVLMNGDGKIQLSLPINHQFNLNELFNEIQLKIKDHYINYKKLNQIDDIIIKSSDKNYLIRSTYKVPLNGNHHKIIFLNSLTTSNLSQLSPCDLYQFKPNENNLLPILSIQLLLAIFNRSDGILHQLIRTTGIAYNFDLSFSMFTGLLNYSVMECANPTKALISFWDLIIKLKDRKEFNLLINEKEILLGKLSLIYNKLSKLDCPSGLSNSMLEIYFNGYNNIQDYLNLNNYFKITQEDLFNSFNQFFINFLNPLNTQTLILSPDQGGLDYVSELTDMNDLSDTETTVSNQSLEFDLSDMVQLLNSKGFKFVQSDLAEF